jgi:hypothetical protein
MNTLGDGLHKPTPMLLILDGVEVRMNLNDLDPNEIEAIEVLKSGNTSMYGMRGSGGVLIITSKKPGEVEVIKHTPDLNAIRVSVMGFYKAREFYSPKYGAADTSNIGQDLRTTVFWKPDVITDKDGNAFFDFYNADLKGIYRVVVEGIDENGNIGRQVYRYRVQ